MARQTCNTAGPPVAGYGHIMDPQGSNGCPPLHDLSAVSEMVFASPLPQNSQTATSQHDSRTRSAVSRRCV
eukprot:5985966-Amphidinium_carterae.3